MIVAAKIRENQFFVWQNGERDYKEFGTFLVKDGKICGDNFFGRDAKIEQAIERCNQLLRKLT